MSALAPYSRTRSALFAGAYWTLSPLHVLAAGALLAVPGRAAVTRVVHRYAGSMVGSLRHLAGIRLEVLGRENLPAEGGFIIAAKHHSWFDGFCMYRQFADIAFVTGDHLRKMPLLGALLDKLGAVVISNQGGEKARADLAANAAKAAGEGRAILIYPEGHLSKAGEHHRYRTGVYYLYRDLGLTVVPSATNLGVFAPQNRFKKRAGRAVIEFLPPIAPGLDKESFMVALQGAIETRSDELIAQACGRAVRPSILFNPPAVRSPDAGSKSEP